MSQFSELKHILEEFVGEVIRYLRYGIKGVSINEINVYVGTGSHILIR